MDEWPTDRGGGVSNDWCINPLLKFMQKNSNLFFNNKQCKYEKRNWNPFSKVMRKRNTKNEIQIRFSKWWENEKQKPKFKSPFQSAAKTKNEIRIRFSMSQVDKKRKIEMEMEFHFTRPKKNEK